MCHLHKRRTDELKKRLGHFCIQLIPSGLHESDGIFSLSLERLLAYPAGASLN